MGILDARGDHGQVDVVAADGGGDRPEVRERRDDLEGVSGSGSSGRRGDGQGERGRDGGQGGAGGGGAAKAGGANSSTTGAIHRRLLVLVGAVGADDGNPFEEDTGVVLVGVEERR